MEPPITVPIDAAALGPVAALSIIATGEETLTPAPTTGIGGQRLEPQMPGYDTQYSDSGPQVFVGEEDELGPDAARWAQEYARCTWAED